MTGAEGFLLRQRLSTYGLSVSAFRYGTTCDGLEQVVSALSVQIRAHGPQVRLFGHSLGGLIILRCLAAYPQLSIGPVLLLGSPVNGSRAARRLARVPGAGWVFGEAAAVELLETTPRQWARTSPIGIVAGDWSFGLGAILADLPAPHDGAVTVAETQLDGATDHRVYHVNHIGLLTSASVARAAAGFLNSGQFPD
jgi:pimeloyl-ACP methyl ester carboxylesterase